MTEAVLPAETPAPMGLFSRVIGIITSPKATYANVVAHPRPFAVLFLCAIVIGVFATIPQWTEEARKQSLATQVRAMERFGVTVTPEQYAQMEARSQSPTARAFGIIAPIIFFPIIALVLTALFWAFFNAILGGTATFKQVLAVTAHSYVITALGVVASAPILLYRFKMQMGGPFNLGALAPGLDETSTIARFLSGVSLFSIWGWVNVSTGLSVLYRRNARNISIVLLLLFALLTYGLTSVFGSFMGR